MPLIFRTTLTRCLAAIAALTMLSCLAAPRAHASEAPLFAPVGARAPVPIGWTQFCSTYAKVCDTQPSAPRDVVLDDEALNDLGRVNTWVNHNIKPEPDMDHYGMIQWWRFPDDGAGACHSYALLKRRMLMQAGWPREALLMTIVHEDFGRGEGHAVLTVKTDRGDFILDNLTDDIRLWSNTTYGFYKRQSQADPNVWVWLSDPRTVEVTGAVALH
jgi:predicted transglutaminase-like cysteine proteinase